MKTISWVLASVCLLLVGCLSKSKSYDLEIVGPHYRFHSRPLWTNAPYWSPPKQRSARDVLIAHRKELMAHPGVIGVSLGEKVHSIRVMVARPNPVLERTLPRSIEGYAVVIDVVGPIQTLK